MILSSWRTFLVFLVSRSFALMNFSSSSLEVGSVRKEMCSIVLPLLTLCCLKVCSLCCFLRALLRVLTFSTFIVTGKSLHISFFSSPLQTHFLFIPCQSTFCYPPYSHKWYDSSTIKVLWNPWIRTAYLCYWTKKLLSLS